MEAIVGSGRSRVPGPVSTDDDGLVTMVGTRPEQDGSRRFAPGFR